LSANGVLHAAPAGALMAEDLEIDLPQAEPPIPAELAMAAALDEARAGPGLSPDVKAFFQAQTELAREQRHHLAALFRLDRWSKRLKLLLQATTFAVGVAVAGVLALTVWSAAHSNRLVFEPFSVPPDLVQSGVSGEVVAAKLLDRLSAMQAQTDSNRAPRTYANNWTQQDFKLALPETGVSLAELDSFLRDKLGHDTRISGEVVRTPAGLSLTARAGALGAETVGPDADLDILVTRLGEAVYRQTQPYRYAVYLTQHNRIAEAIPIDEALVRTGSLEDRPWAYMGLANDARDAAGPALALSLYQRSIAAGPDVYSPLNNFAATEADVGRLEAAVRDWRKAASLLGGSGRGLIRADAVPNARAHVQAEIDLQLGAFHDAARLEAEVIASGVASVGFAESARLAQAQDGEHDLTAARATLASPYVGFSGTPGYVALWDAHAAMLTAAEAQDWAGVLVEAGKADALAKNYPGVRAFERTLTAPVTAYAMARRGDLPGAQALIAATPTDCDPCLRARAGIAELAGDRTGADQWFGRAAAFSPSIPFAYAEWGEALLTRGDTEGAISKLEQAHRLGPRFADPLKFWGDALARLGKWREAAIKYDEALKYAPAWAKLHQAREAAAKRLAG
jgi:tetratricopeptide (TPR) repeat protein